MSDETNEIEHLPWAARWMARLIPLHDSPPRQQYKWRVRVGLTLVVATMALVGRTFIDYGIWPASLVFSGFANAQDVQQIVARIDRKEARDLDNLLLELRIKHCSATSPEAKQLYWSRIAPLMVDYLNITGRNYALPACVDL